MNVFNERLEKNEQTLNEHTEQINSLEQKHDELDKKINDEIASREALEKEIIKNDLKLLTISINHPAKEQNNIFPAFPSTKKILSFNYFLKKLGVLVSEQVPSIFLGKAINSFKLLVFNITANNRSIPRPIPPWGGAANSNACKK